MHGSAHMPPDYRALDVPILMLLVRGLMLSVCLVQDSPAMLAWCPIRLVQPFKVIPILCCAVRVPLAF